MASRYALRARRVWPHPRQATEENKNQFTEGLITKAD